MDVPVEALLSYGEVFSSGVFGSEVADDAVDDDEFYVLFFYESAGFVEEEHLVVAVVGAGEDYSFEGFCGVAAEAFGHASESFWSEGSFRIYVQSVAVDSSFFLGELDGDAELVGELGFAYSVFAAEFCGCLGLDSAVEEFIEGFGAGGDEADLFAFVVVFLGCVEGDVEEFAGALAEEAGFLFGEAGEGDDFAGGDDCEGF